MRLSRCYLLFALDPFIKTINSMKFKTVLCLSLSQGWGCPWKRTRNVKGSPQSQNGELMTMASFFLTRLYLEIFFQTENKQAESPRGRVLSSNVLLPLRACAVCLRNICSCLWIGPLATSTRCKLSVTSTLVLYTAERQGWTSQSWGRSPRGPDIGGSCKTPVPH